MDAVEFLRARRKLCDDNVCGESCPLFYCCDDGIEDNRIRQILAVERWAKEHHVKTRQSEFLKMYPNAQKSSDGVLNICPEKIEHEKYKSAALYKACIYSDTGKLCTDCRRDFWLKEIE